MNATPPQGIDRDALIALIVQDSEHESWTAEVFADRILTLVRPVESVVLSPAEERVVTAPHAPRDALALLLAERATEQCGYWDGDLPVPYLDGHIDFRLIADAALQWLALEAAQ